MGCDFAILAYCNRQGNCTDSFSKQKTWCIIVSYDAHHVFYINNSLCGVAKRAPLFAEGERHRYTPPANTAATKK